MQTWTLLMVLVLVLGLVNMSSVASAQLVVEEENEEQIGWEEQEEDAEGVAEGDDDEYMTHLMAIIDDDTAYIKDRIAADELFSTISHSEVVSTKARVHSMAFMMEELEKDARETKIRMFRILCRDFVAREPIEQIHIEMNGLKWGFMQVDWDLFKAVCAEEQQKMMKLEYQEVWKFATNPVVKDNMPICCLKDNRFFLRQSDDDCDYEDAVYAIVQFYGACSGVFSADSSEKEQFMVPCLQFFYKVNKIPYIPYENMVCKTSFVFYVDDTWKMIKGMRDRTDLMNSCTYSKEEYPPTIIRLLDRIAAVFQTIIKYIF